MVQSAFTIRCRTATGTAFVSAILFFCVLAAIYTVLAVYQNYLNLWLQIRWRRWMTQTYLRQWLNTANHYRMQLLGDAADNPDQRIADDLQMFVQSTLSIGIGLLSSVRDAVLVRRHSVDAVGSRRRCICSACHSPFRAIWSGRR